MLQVSKPRAEGVLETTMQGAEFVSPAELYAAIHAFVRRRLSTLLLVLLLAVVVAVAYLMTAPSRFTARAVLVIDNAKNQIIFQQRPLALDQPLDSAVVETQIQILQSDNIARAVLKTLHLEDDREFTSPPSSFIGRTIGGAHAVWSNLFAKNGVPSQDRSRSAAAENFEKYLTVKRVELTHAIEIDFASLEPVRAAEIANAIADAYVDDELNAKYQTARRAATWLQSRLQELREQSDEAEHAVVAYKTKNNIVDTGGRLINDQQIAELNSDLIQARAKTAEAKARLGRVTHVLNVNNLDPAAPSTATVTDSLNNEVIVKLRQQYLQDATKAAEWSARYGANHLAVINLRNRMRELRKAIIDELGRIAQTYQSDFDIAQTREKSMENSLSEIVAQAHTTNDAQVTLHSLQSKAQTYRAVYDSFLQHYMESVQQQSFPLTEARVITAAVPPERSSSPRVALTLAIAALGGLGLGVAAALLRDVADRRLRTPAQVKQHLQTECIAVVPRIGTPRRLFSRPRPAKSDRIIAPDNELLRPVVSSPHSRFSEAIRAVKVAADLRALAHENRVIGVTSSLPNEGKTTIAASLGQLIAHAGSRAVLLDCDLRDPSLTRHLAPDTKLGLVDFVSAKASLEEVLWKDPKTNLVFIPAGAKGRVADHTNEVLASGSMRDAFDALRKKFDYVVVDLSPLAPVVDVRAMTHLIDSFVFVVEWGRTKVDIVEHALDEAPAVHEKLLGAVLNKTDMLALGRYDAHRNMYYNNRYYTRYGYTS